MNKIVETRKKKPRELKLPTFDSMQYAIGSHEVLQSEEDALYKTKPNKKGVHRYDSVCFHCKKEVLPETDPGDDDHYIIYESKGQK